MSNHQLLKACNILYLDHLAVTTPHLMQTLNEYLSLTGARLLKGPAVNDRQQVEYAFVQLQDGIIVEILGVTEHSPISGHVAKGGGPNHFCYAVADMGESIANAISAGGRLVKEPLSDVAFDGRRVAFLYHEALGLFELVEAFPTTTEEGSSPNQCSRELPKPKAHGGSSSGLLVKEKLDEQLAEIFKNIFPKLEARDLEHAKYGVTEGWDSLTHLRLIMSIEERFNLNISPEEMSALLSYELIKARISS